MRKKIIVILGQTAAGKSALAVQIAKKVNGEVISADSRQVYKGLDIGTGKITKHEMQGIPHHMLNIANPKDRFTVVQFKNLSEKKIKQIIKSGKTPIICGGTGFYIDAVTKGVIFPEVPANKKLRVKLEVLSLPSLLSILKKLDKKRLKTIDQKNKVRIIRAIEIVKALGKVNPLKNRVPDYEFIKIGLCLSKEELHYNIEERVNKMFKDGLIKEIQKLKKIGIPDKRLKEFGFEYYNPTKDSVIKGTIKYAKRQMTWFKRDNDIKWYELKDKKGYQQIEKYILSRL